MTRIVGKMCQDLHPETGEEEANAYRGVLEQEASYSLGGLVVTHAQGVFHPAVRLI